MSEIVYVYDTTNNEQSSYIDELKNIKKKVYFYPANYKKNFEAIKNSPKFRLTNLPSLIIIDTADNKQSTVSIVEGDRVKRWITNEQDIQSYKKDTDRRTDMTVGPRADQPSTPQDSSCDDGICTLPPKVQQSNMDFEQRSDIDRKIAPDIQGQDNDDGIGSYLNRKGKIPQSHLQVAPDTDSFVGKPKVADLGQLSGQADDDQSGGQSRGQHRKLTQKQRDAHQMLRTAQESWNERQSEIVKEERPY